MGTESISPSDKRSRYIRHDDEITLDLGQHSVPKQWWSRIYEYAWAMKFAAPGLRMLDAGAGFEYPFAKYLADLSPGTVVAADKSRWEYPGLISRIEDIITLPESQRGEYDVVFCISVMEHLPEASWRPTLERFHAVLKMGGLLVLTADITERTNPVRLLARCELFRNYGAEEEVPPDALVHAVRGRRVYRYCGEKTREFFDV